MNGAHIPRDNFDSMQGLSEELAVKHSLLVMCCLVLFASCAGIAQNEPDSSNSSAQETAPPPPVEHRPAVQNSPWDEPAFSRVGVGVGISPLGIGMQVSTNVAPHLNLRAFGNVFRYNSSFTISDVPASAGINLASAGAAADYYPFRLGFRVTGGLLFVNDNQVSASAQLSPGDSITLNDKTYYSASPNSVTGATPLTGSGSLKLNGLKPGGLITTGWGNHAKPNGHWSFPFELGVAFIGKPKVAASVNGWACLDQAQTMCADLANTNNPIAQQFQSNLNAQIAKWNSDISALEAYPVVSFGVSYTFRTGRY